MQLSYMRDEILFGSHLIYIWVLISIGYYPWCLMNYLGYWKTIETITASIVFIYMVDTQINLFKHLRYVPVVFGYIIYVGNLTYDNQYSKHYIGGLLSELFLWMICNTIDLFKSIVFTEDVINILELVFGSALIDFLRLDRLELFHYLSYRRQMQDGVDLPQDPSFIRISQIMSNLRIAMVPMNLHPPMPAQPIENTEDDDPHEDHPEIHDEIIQHLLGELPPIPDPDQDAVL